MESGQLEKRGRFAVTAVDVGDTADGHAELLGVFDTEDEAKKYVIEDMKDTLSGMGADQGTKVDWDKFEVWVDDSMASGCIWDIHDLEGKHGES